MVFKLGIRLLNMETPTLSPSAPETRRGFFFLITSGYGCGGGRDQRGSCWRRNSRHEAGNDFPARLQKVRRGAAPCSKAQPDTATTNSLRSAFRAQAWQAANAKARELGWIV